MRATSKGAKYRNLNARDPTPHRVSRFPKYCGVRLGRDRRPVANLLRDDSAGRADSTSAALGGAAYLGWLVRESPMTPPNCDSMQPRACCISS